MKTETGISARAQDYLKSIYLLGKEHEKVMSKELCREMRVSASSVTSMLKKLAKMQLAIYNRYGVIRLTLDGKKAALEMIRHHRLLETFLMKVLGYGLDKVHAEADGLEHIISEEFEDRISALLGSPEYDPHGSPIPGKDGKIIERNLSPLTDLEPGRKAVVAQLLHRIPARLKYLEDLGLVPGKEVSIIEQKPCEGPLLVAIGETVTEYISHQLAGQILVISNNIAPHKEG